MSLPQPGTKARIYRPSPSPTQSGRGMRSWILEFEPTTRETLDPLMGWPGYGDVDRQVTLSFPTCERAVQYAREHELDYAIQPEQRATWKRRSYADNFIGHGPRGPG